MFLYTNLEMPINFRKVIAPGFHFYEHVKLVTTETKNISILLCGLDLNQMGCLPNVRNNPFIGVPGVTTLF